MDSPLKSNRVLVAVTFLAAVGIYNPGETAGFPPEEAESYISRGLAVKHEAPSPAAAPEKPAKGSKPSAPPAAPPAATGDGAQGGDPAVTTGDATAIAPNLDLHELNAADAIEYVADEKDLAKLKALRAGELLHPKYEGGRMTVLEQLDIRIAELSTAATGDGAQG